jgi:hypothetical protein
MRFFGSACRRTGGTSARRAVAIIVSLLVLIVGASVPAQATNWGADPSSGHYCTSDDPYSECSADNSWHYLFIESNVDADLAASIRASMSADYSMYIDDPIQPYWELLTSEVSNKDNADVVVKWADFPDSTPWGYTTCAPNATNGASGWNKWCKRQQIWFDASDPYPCFSSGSCRAWVSCHEMGHNLGLQHPGTGSSGRSTCMKQNQIPGPGYLDNHDREHLIDCYRHPSSYDLTAACEQFGV